MTLRAWASLPWSEVWNLPKFVVAIGMMLLLLEDQIEHNKHLALHDPLTGLPNRRLFEDRMASAVERSRRTGTEMALLVIDLNDFKHVNDTITWATWFCSTSHPARRTGPEKRAGGHAQHPQRERLRAAGRNHPGPAAELLGSGPVASPDGNHGAGPGASKRPNLYVYAQCLRGKRGGVAVLAINADREQAQDISLPTASTRYTLTAPDLMGTATDLNGAELTAAANGTLPAMDGAAQAAGTVELRPLSITFFAVPGANGVRDGLFAGTGVEQA